MGNDAEQIFMYLFPIYISSLVKLLFTHLKILGYLFTYSSVLTVHKIYSWYKSFVRYVILNTSLC
jgi:hypothetical protein